MALPKHFAIRDAVAACLVAGSLAGGRVYKNRDTNLDTGVDSQVHVDFVSTTALDVVIYTSHPRDWETTISVVILARKAGGVEASDCAGTLWAAADALLMADQTLGGLVSSLRTVDVEVQDAEGGTSLCRLQWTLAAQHRTTNNTIT